MNISNVANEQIWYEYGQENMDKGNEKANILGKDAFLNLLVTQLRNQDPLNPMDDKEFISQMAQFSTLEQMQNLDKNLQKSQAEIKEAIEVMNFNYANGFDMLGTLMDNIKKNQEDVKISIENMGTQNVNRLEESINQLNLINKALEAYDK